MLKEPRRGSEIDLKPGAYKQSELDPQGLRSDGVPFA